MLKYVNITAIIMGTQLLFPSLPYAQEPAPKPAAASSQPHQTGIEESKAVGGPTRENPKEGLRYVWISPGKFMMGCSPGDDQCEAAERPAHQVTITKGFWMGQTEVTIAAYKRFAAEAGKQMPAEPVSSGKQLNPGWRDDGMPIVDVTWLEAQSYCGWAGGRLPTEAEWEYTARAGNTLAHYGNLDEVAWYADNSGNQHLDSSAIANDGQVAYMKRLNENGNDMHHVGLKQANAFGLFDMLGNAWEWVNDWYGRTYYEDSPSRDPTGPAREEMRVMRGGSWSDLPWHVRVSGRTGVFAAYSDNNLGFRCAGDVFPR